MANIETADAYLMGSYSFFDSQPIQFSSYPKNHQLLGSLATNNKIERLKRIVEGWYTITKKNDQLFFNDLRFGLISLDSEEERFAFSYRIVPKGEEVMVEETPKLRSDAKHLLAALWLRIWGN